MEKWRSKGKSLSKEESVLPPTKRSSGQNCLSSEKKKDRKWSFGGLLRRISPGQNNEASSNEEDITYIPGHMLPRKHMKKISRMKSRIGKLPRRDSAEERAGFAEGNYGKAKDEKTSESVDGSSRSNVDRSLDSLCAARNDSTNSQSSEGSLDALGKNSKIGRVKARAEAKRIRSLVDSSSEDDSHRSSQSSTKFRSEEGPSQLKIVQRVDSCSKRTRGARTERYIKRMSRDDCNSSSDNKTQKHTISPFPGQSILDSYSNRSNSSLRRALDSSRISSPAGSSSGIVGSQGFINNERILPPSAELYYRRQPSNLSFYDRDRSVIRDCEKFTWPKTNYRRSNPTDEIYGSLKPRQIRVEEKSDNEKLLPPEPPPRSSKSRFFSNLSNDPTFAFNDPNVVQHRRYYQPGETTDIRCCNSDNEIFRTNYWSDFRDSAAGFPDKFVPRYGNDSRDSSNRTKNAYEAGTNHRLDYHASCKPSSYNRARTTCSLPKGVELFSRQKLINCSDNETNDKVPRSTPSNITKPTSDPVPRPRSRNSQSPEMKRIVDDNEAKRRRSSKNLQEALFELEAIYNSLRLSDPDLLERAEQRTMEEYRDNAAKNDAEYEKNCIVKSCNNNDALLSSSQADTNLRMSDDMAYRRMHPKERPPSVNGQSSLSQISYLASSPNLSIRDSDFVREKSKRSSSPDLTRDDLLYRNISHAINTLKVIEPQPPFGIPLGPVTGATESDYLHVKPTPTKYNQTRSLYIPKSEPDVVSDDLAFRNLRKDKDQWIGTNKNANVYLQSDSLIEPRFTINHDSTRLGARNKRAVRSNSADLFGKDIDWYNDYVKSTKKLNFSTDDKDRLNDSLCRETSDSYHHRNNVDLDINGNRPKSALQRKILVNVPPENPPCDNDKCSSPQDSSTSDPQRVVNVNKIEQFTEQEISEYKQLCQDLEKLIQKTADEENEKKRKSEDNNVAREDHNSPSEIDDWERMFNDDYDVPASILNFNDCLENPNAEKDDDGSSDNSLTLPKNKIDESSTSELGIIYNDKKHSSDSVYEKFHRLLKDVDDAPFVECTRKIGEYLIDKAADRSKIFPEAESTVQRRLVGSRKDDGGSKRSGEKSDEISDNSISQQSTKNLRDLKNLTRRMRNEGKHNEARGTSRGVEGDENHAEMSLSREKGEEKRLKRVSYDGKPRKSHGEMAENLGNPSQVFDRSPEILTGRKQRERYTEENLKRIKGLAQRLDESNNKSRFKTDEGKMKVDSKDNTEIFACREGEKRIEDEAACNDDANAFHYEQNSVHKFGKASHVTNSVTICDIVLCSFFLTLLITILFAQ